MRLSATWVSEPVPRYAASVPSVRPRRREAVEALFMSVLGAVDLRPCAPGRTTEDVVVIVSRSCRTDCARRTAPRGRVRVHAHSGYAAVELVAWLSSPGHAATCGRRPPGSAQDGGLVGRRGRGRARRRAVGVDVHVLDVLVARARRCSSPARQRCDPRRRSSTARRSARPARCGRGCPAERRARR